MEPIKTEKDLAKAINNGDSEIIIEGDLAKKTFRIHATGNVAWGIAIAAIIVAVTAAYTTAGSAGTSTPLTGPAMAFSAVAATSTIGVSATTTAISIALASGGVATGISVLTKLRKYKVIEHSKNKLVLKKK